MASIQERLQIKREPLDKWSVREQLCLASAVARSGDQNWMSVSRALKPFGDSNRPSDWFHQKNCAAQYGALLENVETPKRKKRVSGQEVGIETPTESILRKLTAERRTELNNLMAEERAEFSKLQDEMTLLQSGNVTEDQLDQWCKEIDEEEKQKEQEALAHSHWLKERELRKQEIERVWRPIMKVSPVVVGQKRKASDSMETMMDIDNMDETSSTIQEQPVKPPISPLLTSLLKSPSHAQNIVTSSILHSAITSQRVTNSISNPTITSLLNSTTNVTVSPGLQQLVSTAIGQQPSIQENTSTNILQNDILDDASDTLPNLKVEDIERTILSSNEPLPEIKNEEVEVIISDLIENAADIVTDPEQHLKLDGSDDIISNLENELDELVNEENAAKEEEARVEQARLEALQRAEQERQEQERLKKEQIHQEQLRQEQMRLEQERQEQARLDNAKLEKAMLEKAKLEKVKLEKAKLENAKLENMKLENAKLENAKLENAKLENAKLEKLRQEKLKLDRAKQEKAKQEEAKRELVKRELAKREQAKREQAKIEQAAEKAAQKPDPFEFEEDPVIFQPKPSSSLIKAHEAKEVIKQEPEDEPAPELTEEDVVKEIKKEVLVPEEKEKKVVPGSVEIVEVVVLEDEELDKELNKSQIQDIVHSSVDIKEEPVTDSEELEELQVESIPDNKSDFDDKSEKEASMFDDQMDSIEMEMKNLPTEKKEDTAETESDRPTFTPEFSDDIFDDLNIAVTKLDKVGKAKRDYTRKNKKEEKDIDLILASAEQVDSGDLEDLNDTFSEKEYHEEKKLDIKVKIKNETDRSNSPWTEEEEPLSKGTSRRYSTPATPIDSIPNSPASGVASEDDREYRNWKKSVMLVYSRLATHKYASLFLKPITNDQAPGYHGVVYRPMDLQTIRKHVESGVIRTTAEFQRDVLLMFNNAIMYNKTNDHVYNMARQMQQESIQQIQILLQVSSDVPARRETRTSEPGSKRKRGPEENTRNKKRKED